jgi:hypothetical protein
VSHGLLLVIAEIHNFLRRNIVSRGSRKSKQKGKERGEPQHSTIAQHKKQGNVLVPPLAAIPNLQPASWLNERLPEMLWAVLLISELDRSDALAAFRRVAEFAPTLPEGEKRWDVTHSKLAQIPEPHLVQILDKLCSLPNTKTALRPLLLMEHLPGYSYWQKAISDIPIQDDWEILQRAVGTSFYHQSQEATDCRWLRLVFHMLAGQIHMGSKERIDEIIYYPTRGDMTKVRPTIRASEISLNSIHSDAELSNWPQIFWDDCLHNSDCLIMDRNGLSSINIKFVTTTQQVQGVASDLADHAFSTVTTTGIDPKHDAVFGIASYAVSILSEILRMGNSTGILGRLGLRALLECHITLAYLVSRDDNSLWLTYRNYGSGQAKLAFLKLDDDDLPNYVSKDLLEALASEDQWQEFVSINLGNWEKTNLRSMSEAAQVKPEYDRFYPWTSAYVHGNWAAIRSVAFDQCLNPLHRLHRILRETPIALDDVVSDACLITDQTLDLVDKLYPDFKSRTVVATSE